MLDHRASAQAETIRIGAFHAGHKPDMQAADSYCPGSQMGEARRRLLVRPPWWAQPAGRSMVAQECAFAYVEAPLSKSRQAATMAAEVSASVLGLSRNTR